MLLDARYELVLWVDFVLKIDPVESDPAEASNESPLEDSAGMGEGGIGGSEPGGRGGRARYLFREGVCDSPGDEYNEYGRETMGIGVEMLTPVNVGAWLLEGKGN